MVLNRLKQMLIKEFIQTFRDPRMRFTLFVPLVLQMLIFGYAATFELKQVPIAVLDLDHSYESRDLLDRFTSNGHFELRARPLGRHQLTKLIDDGSVTLAIQILPGFSEAVRKGKGGEVQAILDGTDSNTASIALGYIAQIAATYSQDYGQQRLMKVAPSIVSKMPSVSLERRPWYNEDLNSQWFFVPGTIGNLLTVSVLTLASFGIVRERELGTLEQIMVSPMSRLEFILGKTIPAFTVAMCQLALVMAITLFWFKVPFRGSFSVMILGTCLFVLSILGAAIFISTISANQQQALMGAFFYSVPVVFLSGFAFPISSMPSVFRGLTYLIPLRYFLVVVRDSFLKGVGIGVLWPQIGALAIATVAFLGLSTLRFHKTLE